MAEAHLSKIIKVELKPDLFDYDIERGFKVLKSEIEIAPVLVEGNGRLWSVAPGQLVDKLMQMR